MSIKWNETNGVIVLHLKDNLMGGVECLEVKDVLSELVEKGYKNFVIDFTKLTWANSAGIGAIISCYHSIHRLGGEMKFASPTPKIKFYLHISKLDTVFKIYTTVDEAVASFAPAPVGTR